VRQPYNSYDNSITSSLRGNLLTQPEAQMQNNFMMDDCRSMAHREQQRKIRGDAYFPRADMEIESGYPSESEASQKNKWSRQVTELD